MIRSALLFVACVSMGSSARLGLPEPLATYASWHRLSAAPKVVPPELAVLCAPVSKRQFDQAFVQASKVHGPHTNRYIRVLINPEAEAAFSSADASLFPTGAVIAKEKLARPEDAVPEAVAFMIKHGPGEFAASGGWEFRFYPSLSGASYSSCIECHKAGGTKDYVFSRPE